MLPTCSAQTSIKHCYKKNTLFGSKRLHASAQFIQDPQLASEQTEGGTWLGSRRLAAIALVLQEGVNQTGKMAMGAAGGAMDALGGAAGAVSGAVGGAAGAVSGAMGDAAGAVSDALGGAAGAVSGAMGGAAGVVSGEVSGAVGGAAGA